jgi:hypothetical protein
MKKTTTKDRDNKRETLKERNICGLKAGHYQETAYGDA